MTSIFRKKAMRAIKAFPRIVPEANPDRLLPECFSERTHRAVIPAALADDGGKWFGTGRFGNPRSRGSRLRYCGRFSGHERPKTDKKKL